MHQGIIPLAFAQATANCATASATTLDPTDEMNSPSLPAIGNVDDYERPTVWDLMMFGIWTLPFIPHEIEVTTVLYWAGFVPSIWMWLYMLTLFVTRGFLRSEKLVTWLRWALDVEKNPFRSIGAVAATLAFIASVAIILVSAEVSRISAAS